MSIAWITNDAFVPDTDTSSCTSEIPVVVFPPLLGAGAAVYHFGFDMPFDEALYFCVVTGTTVGCVGI